MSLSAPRKDRVVIRNVSPEIDGGRFAIKRTLAEQVSVTAEIFADGHDALSAILKYRHESQPAWKEALMTEFEADRWVASFTVNTLGAYLYTVEAWENRDGDRRRAAEYGAILRVVVDPVLARFGAWYQVFPRSCASEPARHGAFSDLARLLPKLAEMGFDVVVSAHSSYRADGSKRQEQHFDSAARRSGQPLAVGSEDGGHKAVHPELGTLDDVRTLLSQARDLGMEIALDIALQCSPDHPYVKERPEWFRRGPDGSIQCGEDPPHRYEDVYPFDFDSEDWRSLWQELKSIFVFWIEQGARVFRVDNPHTKPFPFWEWLISDLKSRWPELIFLAEGLTHPEPMIHLARVGFSLSYDYFPWRNSKAELTEYYSLLTQSELKEFFRPCLWPNTPQHLPAILQHGGRAAFMIRLILAATLGASCGIYGPAYELCEDRAAAPGSVDYLDSEQFELKYWDWDKPGNLRELITLLNQIRRANPALRSNERLRFHGIENDQVLVYSKTDAAKTNSILTVVNLDPHHTQSGWVDLALGTLGIDADKPYTALDLLTGAQYLWQGARNYVLLNPAILPAHILRLEQG